MWNSGKKKFFLTALILAALISVFLKFGTKNGIVNVGNQEKVLCYGTSTYCASMKNIGINPHSNYAGYNCVKYGVGETLFRISDDNEPEPWLAESYEYKDDKTVVIKLRDDVYFSDGRKMDAKAVLECLDDLRNVHGRAHADLDINSFSADEQEITIRTKESCPSLIKYLCEPYAAIINMKAENINAISVTGTGPYVAQEVTSEKIVLCKNENYWGNAPKLDKIIIKQMEDTDALVKALENNDIDIACGIPQSQYAQFNSRYYNIISADSDRTIEGQVNYNSKIMQDRNVRSAIACLINNNELKNYAINEQAKDYYDEDKIVSDIEQAKTILEQDGWIDTDGDGIVDKSGKKLTIQWLTYPQIKELNIYAQNLKYLMEKAGIELRINCTSAYNKILNTGKYDIFGNVLGTNVIGDREYFLKTYCLKDSSENYGNYYNENIEELAKQLHTESVDGIRTGIADKMQRIIDEDNAFFECATINQKIITSSKVVGIKVYSGCCCEISSYTDKNAK